MSHVDVRRVLFMARVLTLTLCSYTSARSSHNERNITDTVRNNNREKFMIRKVRGDWNDMLNQSQS